MMHLSSLYILGWKGRRNRSHAAALQKLWYPSRGGVIERGSLTMTSFLYVRTIEAGLSWWFALSQYKRHAGKNLSTRLTVFPAATPAGAIFNMK